MKYTCDNAVRLSPGWGHFASWVKSLDGFAELKSLVDSGSSGNCSLLCADLDGALDAIGDDDESIVSTLGDLLDGLSEIQDSLPLPPVEERLEIDYQMREQADGLSRETKALAPLAPTKVKRARARGPSTVVQLSLPDAISGSIREAMVNNLGELIDKVSDASVYQAKSLEALGKAVSESKPPVVNVEQPVAPTVVVNNDEVAKALRQWSDQQGEVAKALKSLADAIRDDSKAMMDALGKLVSAVTHMEPPIVNMEPSVVNVEAPIVNVAPSSMEKPDPIRLRIEKDRYGAIVGVSEVTGKPKESWEL